MADEDKLAAFMALAGDMGKSMKDKVVQQGVEEEKVRGEARELQERLTVEREQMLSILENDIDALGWDVCPKIYAVSLAEDGTEILNFIQDVEGDEIGFLMHLAIAHDLKNDAVALVMTNEVWMYPDSLTESLKGNPEATQALFAVFPPTEHPDRVESRFVTLVDRTGQTCSIQRNRNREPVFLRDEGVDPRVIAAMKCMLGCDRRFNKMKDAVGKAAAYMAGFLEMFHKGMDECWTEAQYVEAVAEHLQGNAGENGALTQDGESFRQSAQRLMTQMPAELREYLGLQ